jgi:cytochrome b
MENSNNKSYIWSIYNRGSHILMIILFSVCYLLADFEDDLSYHAITGYLLGVVFLLRIIWGFIGSRYSRFRDFNLDKNDLKEYLLSPLSETKEYAGHNPASSYAIIAMMILVFLSIFTGTLAYGIQEGQGLFSGLYSDGENHFFKEVHEIFVNLFLAVIAIHIAAAFLYAVYYLGFTENIFIF